MISYSIICSLNTSASSVMRGSVTIMRHINSLTYSLTHYPVFICVQFLLPCHSRRTFKSHSKVSCKWKGTGHDNGKICFKKLPSWNVPQNI